MPGGNYEAVLELSIVSTIHLLYIITFSGLIILALIYVIYRFKNFKK
jgi:hypothetical protein